MAENNLKMLSDWLFIIRDRLLRAQGYDFIRYAPVREMKKRNIDMIFDVGAHDGRSGLLYRRIGYHGSIVSFEPVSFLFDKLQKNTTPDRQWTAVNVAVGDKNGKIDINVSDGIAGANSILPMADNTLTNAPDQAFISKETVQLRTLDNLIETYYPQGNNLFIKMDIQGYEKRALCGLKNSISRVLGMKVELSLVENYKEEALFSEMVSELRSMGFVLVLLESGWHNSQSGEIYQVDGTFYRIDP